MAFETPPPGVGFDTVTGIVPGVAMSLAGIAAVTRAALTKVVVRAAPFHCTTAPETKLPPLTVSVKLGPPAVALFGTNDDNVGVPACCQLTWATASPHSS